MFTRVLGTVIAIVVASLLLDVLRRDQARR